MSRRTNRSHVVDFTAGYKAAANRDAVIAREAASERTARNLVCIIVAVITAALLFNLMQ